MAWTSTSRTRSSRRFPLTPMTSSTSRGGSPPWRSPHVSPVLRRRPGSCGRRSLIGIGWSTSSRTRSTTLIDWSRSPMPASGRRSRRMWGAWCLIRFELFVLIFGVVWNWLVVGAFFCYIQLKATLSEERVTLDMTSKKLARYLSKVRLFSPPVYQSC